MPDDSTDEPSGAQLPHGLNFTLAVMRLRVQEAWPRLTVDERIKATNCLDRMETEVDFFAEAAAQTRALDKN